MKVIVNFILASVLSLNMTNIMTTPTNDSEMKFVGKFYTSTTLTDYWGHEDTYYQFRSDDESYWMLLTSDEIGEIPVTLQDIIDSEAIPNAESVSWDNYILTMDNGGTTECPFDCPEEYECECEVYDDTFVSIIKY